MNAYNINKKLNEKKVYFENLTIFFFYECKITENKNISLKNDLPSVFKMTDETYTSNYYKNGFFFVFLHDNIQ